MTIDFHDICRCRRGSGRLCDHCLALKARAAAENEAKRNQTLAPDGRREKGST
jgi:hypothetical protein